MVFNCLVYWVEIPSLWGGRFTNFYRYKGSLFSTKIATKIGQFIYKLLTIIFNIDCRCVGGGFAKIKKEK